MNWKTLLLLPLLTISAFTYADRRTNAALNPERNVLAQMAVQAQALQASITDATAGFHTLRDLVESGQVKKAEALAEELAPIIPKMRRQWRTFEQTYDRAIGEGMRLNRQVYTSFLQEHPAVENLIAMKINNRFDHGSPIEQLVLVWQSLIYGQKVEETPQNLKARGDLHGVTLEEGDYLLIFFVNGGFLRGVLEGWTRNQDLVVREYMPLAFVRLQKTQGFYRVLKLEEIRNIARLEVFKSKPRSVKVTPVDRLGNYSAGALNQESLISTTRIDLRPDDQTLLTAVRRKRLDSLNLSAEVHEFKPWEEKSPNYPPVYFLTCGSELAP